MSKYLLPFLFVSLSFNSYSQSILVIVNAESKIYVDGKEQGKVKADDALKISVSQGEHYIQAKGKWNGQEKEVNKTINIESDKQIMVKLSFGDDPANAAQNKNDSAAITVADLNFKLPGTIAVNSWKNDNPGKEYKDNPTYYYAFEKGDEIVIDYNNSGSNATSQIVISTYPGKETKYSNKTVTDLHGIHIKVDERSIYRFIMATNHALSTSGELIIKRIPASPLSKDFNTNVNKVKEYKAENVLGPEESFVNSGSNSFFKNGKSRIIFPLKFPANTVEWYYKFAASRDNDEIAKTAKALNFVGELTTLVGGLTGKALNIAVDQLAKPPGSNYCDVYLLDEGNRNLFEAKEACHYISDGTRENLKSGVVQLKCCMEGPYYIGIKNPDTYYGVAVVIEVVAITAHEEFVMEQQ